MYVGSNKYSSLSYKQKHWNVEGEKEVGEIVPRGERGES